MIGLEYPFHCTSDPKNLPQYLLLEATALNLAAVPVGGIDPKQTAQAASLPVGITPIYLIPVGHAK